jgi:hypothetical protein
MSAKTRDTSRRAVVAGLAAAPVAALPVLACASPASADPIFDAFEEFERAKVADELASKAYEVQQAVTFQATEAAGVNPSQILTRRRLELRHECGLLSDSECAEALTALEGRESGLQAMWSALEDLDKPAEAAFEARAAAERDLLSTAPTTRVGALRLLHHLAELLDGDDVVNDRFLDDVVGDAIRNAIAVFESEALS